MEIWSGYARSLAVTNDSLMISSSSSRSGADHHRDELPAAPEQYLDCVRTRTYVHTYGMEGISNCSLPRSSAHIIYKYSYD